LLDGTPSDSEMRAALEPLLSVRQAARLLGACAATVYRMCEQRELGHFRVRNAIRVPVGALKDYLARARGRPGNLRPDRPNVQGAGQGHGSAASGS